MMDLEKNKFDGFNLQDYVEELRAKCQLKQKDGDAYRQAKHEKMEENEDLIGKLRKDNIEKRKIVHDEENADRTVISNVFQNDKEDLLQLRHLKAPAAVAEMHQKVCNATKLWRATQLEREKKEKMLQDFKKELEDMKSHSKNKGDQQKTLAQLENSLDKMLIKGETASLITKRYKEILTRLKTESVTLPAKLDAMEKALIDQKADLKSLKEIYKKADESREEAKKNLHAVEDEAVESNRKRTAELNATRKEVERIMMETERMERKKGAGVLLLSEQQDVKGQSDMVHKYENQNKILQYEEAFQKIKAASNVSDVEGILERFQYQADTKQKLKSQERELESLRNKTQEEYDKLTTQFHEMKYSGEKTLSRGQKLLEDMKTNLDKEEARKQEIERQLEANGGTLISVKTGIFTLLEKMHDVKLKPPRHNYVKGSVFDHLDLTLLKADQLLTELGSEPMPDILAIAPSTKTVPFQEFMEGKMPEQNVRIKMDDEEDGLSPYDLREDFDETYLSRSDLKRISLKIIESKNPKRKQKRRK